MEDEKIVKLNKLEEKYKIGKIQLSDLVNGAYNLGIEKAESLVKKSNDIHNVIDCFCDTDNYTKHITNSGFVIYKCNTCGGCV